MSHHRAQGLRFQPVKQGFRLCFGQNGRAARNGFVNRRSSVQIRQLDPSHKTEAICHFGHMPNKTVLDTRRHIADTGVMQPKIRPWKPEPGRKFELISVGNASVKLYRRERATKKGNRVIFEMADYTAYPADPGNLARLREESMDTEGQRRRIGRPRRIRTLRGFSDLATARKEAGRVAGNISNGESAAAQMRGPQMASYGRAIELLRPTGISLEIAAATVAKAVQILGADRIIEAANSFVKQEENQITRRRVADVVTELLAKREADGKSKRYLSDLSSRLNRFAAEHLVEISSLTTPDVQRFLDSLTLAPQTVKNFRTVLHTLFRFAERRGYIRKGFNPIADTEKVTAECGTVEIYTPAELLRLIEGARKHCKPYLPSLLIGAFAGLRSSEIERLRWEDVNLARGFITASAKKRGTPSRRLVPILPNLSAWLMAYSDTKGNVWAGTHDQFSEAQWLTAAATAVKANRKQKTAAVAPLKWKHNGLRHSFISYRLATLHDDARVALEAGNSKSMIHNHYKELATPQDADKYFGIAPYLAPNVTQIPLPLAPAV